MGVHRIVPEQSHDVTSSLPKNRNLEGVDPVVIIYVSARKIDTAFGRERHST